MLHCKKSSHSFKYRFLNSIFYKKPNLRVYTHSPVYFFMVPTTGFEPAAYPLRVDCSTIGAMPASTNIIASLFKIINNYFLKQFLFGNH